MIYHFILNPKSGRNRKHKNLEAVIKEACKSRQLSYHIYYTTCPGDATEYVSSMVRISQERQRFICIGGDGTINEVISSAPCNDNVEFGVIPCGSGNDFVRNFTNTELFSDINAQLDGESIPFDILKCNDKYCVNMVNIGFDCLVVKESEKFRRYRFFPSGLSYIAGIMTAVFKKIGTKMKILYDDGTVMDKTFTLVAIGNGKFCGGGFCGVPNACLDDGVVDVCAIDKVSVFKFFTLVGLYKKGTHLKSARAMKVIDYKQVPHFKMEFDEPIPICIDGEITGAKSIEFTTLKNGFNFVIPKGSKYRFPSSK